MQSAALSAAALSPREVVATNGVLGGVTAIARLAGYAFTGELHSALWLPGMIGLVAGAIGAVIGIRISRRGKDSTLELTSRQTRRHRTFQSTRSSVGSRVVGARSGTAHRSRNNAATVTALNAACAHMAGPSRS